MVWYGTIVLYLAMMVWFSQTPYHVSHISSVQTTPLLSLLNPSLAQGFECSLHFRHLVLCQIVWYHTPIFGKYGMVWLLSLPSRLSPVSASRLNCIRLAPHGSYPCATLHVQAERAHMSTEATIAITVEWLCKHKPVVFTNRTKDQPLLADSFKEQ